MLIFSSVSPSVYFFVFFDSHGDYNNVVQVAPQYFLNCSGSKWDIFLTERQAYYIVREMLEKHGQSEDLTIA